jgi:putative endonuclease
MHARTEALNMARQSRRRQYYTYILASHKGVLYTGVTDNLFARLRQHRNGTGSAFAARYKVHNLVCYEVADTALVAIAREKEIKEWRREKKVTLIESMNPYWNDLAIELWPGVKWHTQPQPGPAIGHPTPDPSLRSG